MIANLYNSGRYVSIDYGTQNATVFLLWNRGVDGNGIASESITTLAVIMPNRERMQNMSRILRHSWEG